MPSQTFLPTGAEQTFVVPVGVTSIQFDVAGAQGGTSAKAGALGGRVTGTLQVTPGETLYVRVGGLGNPGVAGGAGGAAAYYGGAKGGLTSNPAGQGGGSGGGESDIRRGGNADSNRVVVGGGGGGESGQSSVTPATVGGVSLDNESTTPATATQGGDGSGLNSGGGGGGGGWRGGAGGAAPNNGGVGGTNMAHSTQTSGVTSTSGYQTGDGYVILTWVSAGTTVAQKFYLDTNNDDGTYGTTIKKLAETAPGANSATTNTWSSTTASTETHIPLAASTTASDTSNSNGWAFNNGGGDGLGSTASAKRVFAAGVWGFSMSYTLNSPALLATIAATVTAKVYRVATGGGTRTLLFSATSANFSATGTITWNSASQPEIVLEAGEVIEIGYTPTSAATAASVLGAVTNTVLTLNLGANSFITVPSPGVRTRFFPSVADTVSATDAVTRVVSEVRALADSAPANDSLARQVAYARLIADTAPVTDSLVRIVTMPRALSDSAPASDSLVRKATYGRTVSDSVPASDSLVRAAAYFRSLVDSALAADSLGRQAAYGRILADSAPVADVLNRQVTANRAISDTAPTSDTLQRLVAYVRSVADASGVTDSLARRMIFARMLQDNLSAGGGTTIIKRTIIFDRA